MLDKLPSCTAFQLKIYLLCVSVGLNKFYTDKIFPPLPPQKSNGWLLIEKQFINWSKWRLELQYMFYQMLFMLFAILGLQSGKGSKLTSIFKLSKTVNTIEQGE